MWDYCCKNNINYNPKHKLVSKFYKHSEQAEDALSISEMLEPPRTQCAQIQVEQNASHRLPLLSAAPRHESPPAAGYFLIMWHDQLLGIARSSG